MPDIIDELNGLDDKALGEKLGFDVKIQNVRASLAEAAATSGDVRKKVVARLSEAFVPSTYVFEDIGYTIKQAQQKAKTGASPSEVISCCCGD